MQAKDVMSKSPKFLPPTATLREAAEYMRNNDFGFIPIGENDRLVGAVTDRDIAIRAIADGKDPNTTQLRDIMSDGIEYCLEDDDIKSVAEHMEKMQIRRLVVLNSNKRLTGIISLGDIATKCPDTQLCSELTEAVSEG